MNVNVSFVREPKAKMTKFFTFLKRVIIQLIKENSKKINRSAKSLHFKYFRRIISNCRTRIADLTKSLCWFWIKIIMKSINILVDFFSTCRSKTVANKSSQLDGKVSYGRDGPKVSFLYFNI